jgi:hypothetical protein
MRPSDERSSILVSEGRYASSRAPIVYRIGIALIVMKAASVVIGLVIHAHIYSRGFGYVVWLLGKTVPELIAIAFSVEARLAQRKKALQIFWLCLVLIVPFYTLYFVLVDIRMLHR